MDRQVIDKISKEFFEKFTDGADADNDYYDAQFEGEKPCHVLDFFLALLDEKDKELEQAKDAINNR